jgi:hypothetical protein
MTATGEITTIGRESWVVALGTAITRWGRRRAVRADLAAENAAAMNMERRAELEELLLMQRELEAHKREMEYTLAMQRLYRGL